MECIPTPPLAMKFYSTCHKHSILESHYITMKMKAVEGMTDRVLVYFTRF